MKMLKAVAATALIVAAGAALAGNPSSNKPANTNPQPQQPNAQSPKASGNIQNTIFTSPNFKTFARALKATGLADTFAQPGPYTVFVPTEEAWSKLPAGTVDELFKPEHQSKLASIVKFHALPERVWYRDLSRMKESSQTLLGQTFSVQFENNIVQIGTNPRLMATVIQAQSDVSCTNGVIHTINAVMMPRE